jgi:hypothetical protein
MRGLPSRKTNGFRSSSFLLARGYKRPSFLLFDLQSDWIRAFDLHMKSSGGAF